MCSDRAPAAINRLGYRHDVKAGPIPFHRVSSIEVSLCVAIAQRAIPHLHEINASLAPDRRYPIDGMLYAMDVAAVHLLRPLDLRRLLHFDPVDFLHDFSAIISNIDRSNGRLPDWLRLRSQID